MHTAMMTKPKTINGCTALHRGRHNPRVVNDLRGAHVRMRWRGRMILGEIVDQYYQPFGAAGWRFRVRHFNGHPWPVDPISSVVEVLLRRTGDEVED
jgi:hypothetical protein